MWATPSSESEKHNVAAVVRVKILLAQPLMRWIAKLSCQSRLTAVPSTCILHNTYNLTHVNLLDAGHVANINLPTQALHLRCAQFWCFESAAYNVLWHALMQRTKTYDAVYANFWSNSLLTPATEIESNLTYCWDLVGT